MYTRASSIRSNYTTSSAKTKFMIPQRIVGGNDTLQHYNALHMTDTVNSTANNVKNNNIMNGNSNWNVKSPWLFNQSAPMGNGMVVEWQEKKPCTCFLKIYGNDHPTCTTMTTMTTDVSMPLTSCDQQQQQYHHQPQNHKNSSLFDHNAHGIAKNCRCQQTKKHLVKDCIFSSRERSHCSSNVDELEKPLNLCTPATIGAVDCSANKFNGSSTIRNDAIVNDDDDEIDGDDSNFRKSIRNNYGILYDKSKKSRDFWFGFEWHDERYEKL